MRGSVLNPARLPWLLLGLALIGGTIWMAFEARGISFVSDDWDYVLHRGGHSLHTFLSSQNGHLVLIPVLIYKTLFVVVGLDHYWPYQAVLFALHLTGVLLLFVLLRRRVGDWLALALALTMLIYGNAVEMIVFANAMNLVGSVVAGLGALLALDRDSRRGDVAACLLIATSLACSTIGVPIALGVLVEVLWRPDRHRRWWIPVAPLALYGLWAVAYPTGHALNWSNAKFVLSYSANMLASSLSGPLGLGISNAWGPALAVVGALFLLRFLVRRPVLSPRLVMLLVILVVFWGLTALARANLGEVAGARYLYPSTVLSILILAEALRGVPLPARLAPLLAVGVVGMILSTAGSFYANVKPWKRFGTSVRSTLGALDLAEGELPKDLSVPAPTYGMTAGQYFDVKHRWGTPAFSVGELRRQSSATRQDVDQVLLGALNVGLGAPTGIAAGQPAPRLVNPGRATASTQGSCLRVAMPPEGTNVVVELPPAGVVVKAGPTPVEVALRRFADGFSQLPRGGTVTAGQTAGLAASRGHAPQLLWQARISLRDRASVCTRAA